MDLLANDVSFHGQFQNIATFRDSLDVLMKLRATAQKFGQDVYCHRNIASSQVTPDMGMQQAINMLPKSQRRAVMVWLTRHGPFWEDKRVHDSDDYIECDGDIVTDTAVGEAAFSCIQGMERRLVSVSPSSWNVSPIRARLWRDDSDYEDIDVVNYWRSIDLESDLNLSPVVMKSWCALARVARTRFQNLTFAADCFDPLRGHPFMRPAAERVLSRLHTLEQLRNCFNEEGSRTTEGHRLIQTHFTGDRAHFSDSSDTEKRDFHSELTFPNPDDGRDSIFCTWHGKVGSQLPLRIHFSWPVQASSKLYVVYVGPKITR